jgi:Flp pilus assembly protein CpaB
MSHLLIAVTALLAFGLNYVALQNRDATTLVAVADGPIAEGTPFSVELVRFAPLPSDFGGLSHLVTENDASLRHGWIVSRSVADGELVDLATLIEPGATSGLRTMSIPVPIEHAAGATLVVGDRVDVISMVDDTAAFVASDLEVVSIADTSQGGIGGFGPYHVVVAVTADEALALATAIDDDSVEVIRSTGAAEGRGAEG